MKIKITTLFLFLSFLCSAQVDSLVNELPRPNTNWEIGFNKRVNEMWGTQIPTYSPNPGSGNMDGGKTEWPKLLSLMQWPTKNYNSTTMASYIAKGRQMVNGANVGSFYSPFSCAGYAMYYFHWKDSIAKYDPSQVELIYSDVNSMWNKLMKTDHVYDPCCGYNALGGKEFNSENFHWMMRAAGYLFAHEIHNKTINGKVADLTNFDFKSLPITIHTGVKSPATKDITPAGVNLIDYFDGFLMNLTRALYNAGRVEWNSNNYFGHTLNPLITIYEGADKCNDPNAAANKKRAQACIDWMLVEAALHYMDGSQVAADSRAKTASFLPFTGSYYQYTIPYFADDENYPSFNPSVWKTKDPTEMEVGFLLSSSYRPPQIIIDIAQRKFPLPVEVQSAKPFYHIDQGQYFNSDGTINGEMDYNAWNGAAKGRRFEFETIWLDKNMTLASAAVGRPDGNLGTFSEQSMWRLGVKGQKNGVRMLSGNAGDKTTTAGRSVEHEIGQFRNMMMQMIKHPSASSNKIWFLVPDSLHQLQTTGESPFWDVQEYKWLGDDLYLKLRNDVFIAVKPYPAPISVEIATTSEAPTHSKLTYNWPANQLGSLVFEVATQNNFSSFIDFVFATQSNKVSVLNENTLSYTSFNNQNIRMEYVEPGSFMMTPFTYDTPLPNPFSPAGSYPKVWGNDNYIDYQTWDSYKTVYGHELLNQAWGSGVMTLSTEKNAAKITIDPVTAEVKYEVKKKVISGFINQKQTIKSHYVLYPNPVTDFLRIKNLPIDSIIQLYNLSGRKILEQSNNPVVDMSNCKPGFFLVKTHTRDRSEVNLVLKK